MDFTYRQQTAITGALVGAVAGAIVALMYANRSLGEKADETSASLAFSDLTRIAIAVGALVRQINSLAEQSDE